MKACLGLVLPNQHCLKVVRESAAGLRLRVVVPTILSYCIMKKTFHCTTSFTDAESVSLAESQSPPVESESHPPADRSQSVTVFTQLSLNLSVKQVSMLCVCE